MAEMKSSTLKPVQEILRSGVVPENYIQPKDEYEVGDGFVPLMDDLTINFSLLSSSSSSSSSPEELTKLRSALSSWGCAQLVNHGMPSTLLDEVQEMGKKFFTLPLEEKEKYSSKGNSLEGYGNDNTIREGSFNWNDKLHLQVYPFCKLGYWPGKPENFRITLQEYSIKTMILLETILKAMARSLNIEEKSFFELWGNDEEDMLHARFNFYPRCPSSDQVIGLKPHGDGTVITILLQDKEVEGLRILKDNRWFRVPIIPEAIVIHVGDLIEIASNGIFKSPTHKVVINPKYDRISLAMLPLPNPDKEIGPLKELVTDERPQLYKRLKDYGQVYFQYISSGKRQINFVKINS